MVGRLNVLSDLELYEGFEASLEVGGGIWYSVERVSEIGIRDNDSSTQCALAEPEVRYVQGGYRAVCGRSWLSPAVTSCHQLSPAVASCRCCRRCCCRFAAAVMTY